MTSPTYTPAPRDRDGLVSSPCIGCEAVDTDPKHRIALLDAETGAPAGAVTWHMDCHALVRGCDVCAGQIAGADGAKGADLRAYLDSIRDTPTTTAPEGN